MIVYFIPHFYSFHNIDLIINELCVFCFKNILNAVLEMLYSNTLFMIIAIKLLNYIMCRIIW